MSKYQILFSSQFKKDFKKYLKQPKEKQAIKDVIATLANEGYLGIPENMVPHKLKGNYKGYWECHVKPDILLIWKQLEEPDNEIALARVGSHSDLF
jgi:mRNA interferase YafQ